MYVVRGVGGGCESVSHRSALGWEKRHENWQHKETQELRKFCVENENEIDRVQGGNGEIEKEREYTIPPNLFSVCFLCFASSSRRKHLRTFVRAHLHFIYTVHSLTGIVQSVCGRECVVEWERSAPMACALALSIRLPCSRVRLNVGPINVPPLGLLLLPHDACVLSHLARVLVGDFVWFMSWPNNNNNNNEKKTLSRRSSSHSSVQLSPCNLNELPLFSLFPAFPLLH